MSGQRTVLVVEDNPITQKMMVVTLRAAGYRVLAASQGQQALEYFERESPDLVVQDLVLPDMDGIELARQIRTRPNGRDTALVALSGLASMLETAQSSAHGFAGCLFKPVEPSRLVAHLAEILRPDAASPRQRHASATGAARGRRPGIAQARAAPARGVRLRRDRRG